MKKVQISWKESHTAVIEVEDEQAIDELSLKDLVYRAREEQTDTFVEDDEEEVSVPN